LWTVTPRVESIRSSTKLRAVLWTILGALLGAVGGFFDVVALIGVLVADEEDTRYGALFILFGGLIPTIAGVIALYFGIRGFVAASRWKTLAVMLRASPALKTDDIARSFNIPLFKAERMLGGAMRVGVLAYAPDAPGPVPSMGYLPVAPNLTPSVMPAMAEAATLASPGLQQLRSVPPPSLTPAFPLQAAPFGIQFPAQLVGRLIRNTYQVEALLGSGGMGAVFRVRHMRTGRRYALKMLLGDATVESFKRFEREATAASSLGHPGIIAVHDFDRSEEGIPFLVMDLLEGETLAARLERRGQLLWSDVRRISLEAGDALAVAHEAGLLHRDVKPANLFIASGSSSGERVVLLDFGLVKPLDPNASKVTVSGASIGTPLYMAPEQARGESVDVRTDVYGLGAVVFEMVTGAPPFLDTNMAAVYARLLSQDAPPPSTIAPRSCPPGLDAITARALAKNPAARYPSMRAMLSDVAQLRPPTAGSTVLV